MEEVKQGGSGKKWLFGCCGGLVLFVFLLGGVGYFGAGWAKNKGVTLMTEGIAKSLDAANLPEDEVDAINAQMQRLEAAVKSWGVLETFEHLGNLETVAPEVESIGYHVVLLSYGQYVLPNTPMPDEERAAGQRTIQRCARAVDEGLLVIDDEDDAWEFDADPDENGQVQFDVEQVRGHLARLKLQVDALQIPDEPYQVNMSDRITTIVGAILGE